MASAPPSSRARSYAFFGESGSDKSVTLRALMRLLPPQRTIESGPVAQILNATAHPYTAGLLASTVRGQRRDRDIDAIPGSPPDLRRLPQGCSLAPRCSRRMADCRITVPEPRFPAPGHMAACHATADCVPATQVTNT